MNILTASWTAIAFQVDRMLRSKKTNYRGTIQELMILAEAYRTRPERVPELLKASEDHLLREAMNIVLDQTLDEEKTGHILRARVTTISTRYSADAKMFRAMGKFPPAMGLMGAALGMIALSGSLDKFGAETTIGPVMAVGLIATFYGIALANIVVLPLAQNAADLRIKNNLIVEGVLLIAKKTNPILLAEELNSYLRPGDRLDAASAAKKAA